MATGAFLLPTEWYMAPAEAANLKPFGEIDPEVARSMLMWKSPVCAVPAT